MWMIPSELTQAMAAMASGSRHRNRPSMSPPRTVRSARLRGRLPSGYALGPFAQQVSHNDLDGAGRSGSRSVPRGCPAVRRRSASPPERLSVRTVGRVLGDRGPPERRRKAPGGCPRRRSSKAV
jgi:hypothetical protein